MQVVQITLTETPHLPRVGRMNRWGRGGPARAKTDPADATRAVRRVLKDRPLPKGQQALMQALYEAGDAGLMTSELTALLNRDEQQFNRLLARMARRIRRTPSARVLQRPGITLLFDITPIEGEWRYKLRPVVRKALNAQS
jgi:hypothetical protein